MSKAKKSAAAAWADWLAADAGLLRTEVARDAAAVAADARATARAAAAVEEAATAAADAWEVWAEAKASRVARALARVVKGKLK